jgi:broad specificity phosphatase PhoE
MRTPARPGLPASAPLGIVAASLRKSWGRRRGTDGLTAVFTFDLRRATQTAELAFGRFCLARTRGLALRECDYAQFNGASVAQVHSQRRHRLTTPCPGGESWAQAVRRVGRFLEELPTRWAGQRILVIGHLATPWAFDHLSLASGMGPPHCHDLGTTWACI